MIPTQPPGGLAVAVKSDSPRSLSQVCHVHVRQHERIHYIRISYGYVDVFRTYMHEKTYVDDLDVSGDYRYVGWD